MTTPQPENSAAVSFLRLWAPEGPWALTCIQTDRKAIDTRTFFPTDEAELLKWLGLYNGQRNIYFHVNPVLKPISKKAEREDIKELAWLHVDIDPRAGESIEDERRRALEMLTTRLPKGVPKPTCVVFSGGGYQGFWRLREPAPINGESDRYEDLKRYNQQLERLFGGDNCHNVDRIMRLPGTLNIPDARKIKKGRSVELARVVEFNEEVYELSDFTPAPAVQLPGEKGLDSKPKVSISGNIERLAEVNELDKWNVTDRVKVAIVQGKHPDQPKEGDNSRSSWLFDVCCNLVRCGVPDEVIFSVITDPGFGISESVLELGSRAERYALRQIERAKEEADDPWLRKLNDQYAVIQNIGGKCRVVEEIFDFSLKRSRLSRKSFDDFRNAWMNHFVQVGLNASGPILKPVGHWWLSHPQRRQFKTIVFAPGEEVGDAYNMWKGFACDSIPGDCDLFLEHVKRNVCGGDEDHYNYLVGWLARAVQQPASPGEVAVVLRGGRGTGKSFFAKQVGSLFGRHFMQVSNPSHLVGHFNAHLRDVVLLFADEAFYANDKKHESILKTLVTEDTLVIEAKGIDAEVAANYVHLIMASNSQHIVPAGGDERRYFVLDVGREHQQDTTYFAAIAKQMDSGGRQALLHFLLTYDLNGYEVRNVPQTDALREQKLFTMSVEEEWWYRKLCDGRAIDSHGSWKSSVVYTDLVDDFVNNTRRWNITRRGSETSLGRFLTKVLPRFRKTQRMEEVSVPMGEGWTRQEKRRVYVLELPSLRECRGRWDEMFGANDWPEPVAEQPELGPNEPPF